MCLSVAVYRPDDVLANGEYLGFEWFIVQNGSGYRCGYVKVEPGHPWHGKEYDEIDVSVHGGLTFARAGVPCDKGGLDNGWWLGFDCAHAGDLPDPALPGCDPLYHQELVKVYKDVPWAHGVRTQEYVLEECKRLCEQAYGALEEYSNVS